MGVSGGWRKESERTKALAGPWPPALPGDHSGTHECEWPSVVMGPEGALGPGHRLWGPWQEDTCVCYEGGHEVGMEKAMCEGP